MHLGMQHKQHGAVRTYARGVTDCAAYFNSTSWQFVVPMRKQRININVYTVVCTYVTYVAMGRGECGYIVSVSVCYSCVTRECRQSLLHVVAVSRRHDHPPIAVVIGANVEQTMSWWMDWNASHPIILSLSLSLSFFYLFIPWAHVHNCRECVCIEYMQTRWYIWWAQCR